MLLGLPLAAWALFDRWSSRKTCAAIGHTFSWRTAVQRGITDRQVCACCKAEWPPR